MSSVIQYEHEFRRLSWLWAYCYDNKDWKQLESICSPQFKMYYGELDPSLGDKIVSVQDFVAAMSAQTSLGDSRLKTQHFLGSVMFEQEDDDSVVGNWQIQGLHRRNLADGTVASWNVHLCIRHYYRCDGEGVWKLDGLKPSIPLFMDGVPTNVLGEFE
ncbi:hypothetical protein KCU81_g9625, partial [Aureobasidium melanogenum]|uniref:Scytalone dehydratase-like domain-containing protein n=1 Tax=Aureobasidium melanogenum (strain CBS 110374) TaxID=1043003 RepID=A0A074VAU3_AURM1